MPVSSASALTQGEASCLLKKWQNHALINCLENTKSAQTEKRAILAKT